MKHKLRRHRSPLTPMRRIGGWMFTLALAYSVFLGVLWLAQGRLMYFPDPAPFVPEQWALKELSPVKVTTSDGLTLTSWYTPARSWDKFTLVFFQGNAGHLGYRNYKVRPWIDAGYGVYMIGYRGYGNDGHPSELGLYMDARASLDTLMRMTDLREENFVFYGESMGTGVATQMATERHEAALILESPYTSVPDVGASRYPFVPVRWLLKDNYNSLEKIGHIDAPLLLLHGEEDRVVPAQFGRRLFDAAAEPKQAEFVPDAGHNDVYTPHVQQVILAFLARLPTDPLLKRHE